MPDDIAFLRSEILHLHAETLALQMLLFNLLAGLRRGSTMSSVALEKIFDDTVNALETFAIVVGEKASPTHTVDALRVIELSHRLGRTSA